VQLSPFIDSVRAGRFGVRILVSTSDFALPQDRTDRLWGSLHLPYNKQRVPFPGVKWPGLKLITRFRRVPNLRIGGVIPLLLLYTFMVWTGTTLPFYNYYFFYAVKLSHTDMHPLHKERRRI